MRHRVWYQQLLEDERKLDFEQALAQFSVDEIERLGIEFVIAVATPLPLPSLSEELDPSEIQSPNWERYREQTRRSNSSEESPERKQQPGSTPQQATDFITDPSGVTYPVISNTLGSQSRFPIPGTTPAGGFTPIPPTPTPYPQRPASVIGLQLQDNSGSGSRKAVVPVPASTMSSMNMSFMDIELKDFYGDESDDYHGDAELCVASHDMYWLKREAHFFGDDRVYATRMKSTLLQQKLKGAAWSWFDGLEPEVRADWNKLTESMKRRFPRLEREDYISKAWEELHSIHQGEKEDLARYIDRARDLVRRVNVSTSFERQAIDSVRKGFRDSYLGPITGAIMASNRLQGLPTDFERFAQIVRSACTSDEYRQKSTNNIKYEGVDVKSAALLQAFDKREQDRTEKDEARSQREMAMMDGMAKLMGKLNLGPSGPGSQGGQGNQPPMPQGRGRGRGAPGGGPTQQAGNIPYSQPQQQPQGQAFPPAQQGYNTWNPCIKCGDVWYRGHVCTKEQQPPEVQKYLKEQLNERRKQYNSSQNTQGRETNFAPANNPLAMPPGRQVAAQNMVDPAMYDSQYYGEPNLAYMPNRLSEQQRSDLCLDINNVDVDVDDRFADADEDYNESFQPYQGSSYYSTHANVQSPRVVEVDAIDFSPMGVNYADNPYLEVNAAKRTAEEAELDFGRVDSSQTQPSSTPRQPAKKRGPPKPPRKLVGLNGEIDVNLREELNRPIIQISLMQLINMNTRSKKELLKLLRLEPKDDQPKKPRKATQAPPQNVQTRSKTQANKKRQTENPNTVLADVEPMEAGQVAIDFNQVPAIRGTKGSRMSRSVKDMLLDVATVGVGAIEADEKDMRKRVEEQTKYANEFERARKFLAMYLNPRLRLFYTEATVGAQINGKFSKIWSVLIDGGALAHLIPEWVVRKAQIPTFADEGLSIMAYDGNARSLKAYCLLKVTVAGISREIIAFVLPESIGHPSYTLLLARGWMRSVNLIGDYAADKYYASNTKDSEKVEIPRSGSTQNKGAPPFENYQTPNVFYEDKDKLGKASRQVVEEAEDDEDSDDEDDRIDNVLQALIDEDSSDEEESDDASDEEEAPEAIQFLRAKAQGRR
ncbi:MAG: hypothetical protein Q9227_003706 [Pyrenula ochraceoflavens]